MSDRGPDETARQVDPGQVDPWRFAGGFLQKLLSARIPDAPAWDDIPWTPFSKPLSQSKVALLSTAGLSMRGDAPFDMEMERAKPTIGDPSWRRLRADATSASIEANHLHIDTGYILRDLVGAGSPDAAPDRGFSR